MRTKEIATVRETVPIRYGLITWAAIKIIVALCSQGYLFLSTYFLLFIEEHKQYDAVLIMILFLMQIALLVDSCMSTTLIFGESRKNSIFVTAYFRYAIYAVITSIIVIFVYTVYELILYAAEDIAPWKELRTFDLTDVVKLASIGTIYVLFDLFIIYEYLLRTDVKSLRSQPNWDDDDVWMVEEEEPLKA